MKLNPDEYEGLRSFQVLTPAQKKKVSVFRQNSAIFYFYDKKKRSEETWNHSNIFDEKNADFLHFFIQSDQGLSKEKAKDYNFHLLESWYYDDILRFWKQRNKLP